jgi:hypothetical protein
VICDRSKVDTENAVSLKMLQFDVQKGWKQVKLPEDEQNRVIYMGEPGDVHYITLTHGSPDLPALDDVVALQAHFRDLARKSNGGIVSVDVTEVQGMPAVVYFTKEVREKIRGYRYVARCLIPLKTDWFEVRMGAIEMTVATGARESVVNAILGADLEYEEIPPDAAPTPGPILGKSTGKRIKGWFKDPYDPKYDSSAMCCVSDHKKYDGSFPAHPLSRLRKKFPEVLKHIKKNPALKSPKKTDSAADSLNKP